MTVEPEVSVVVPTCGRPQSLRRLFGRLSWQASAPPFEVVVVLDGVTAATAGVEAADTAWPFVVRVATLHGPRGAAAARNLGALTAQGRVLLFLDDDVEPGPGVVAAHAHLHARHEAVIGAGALVPRPVCGGFIGHALAGWWEVMNERLCDPGHRFTFRDLLTGHCSMSRATFERVGPFDETLRCHEDFEFGFRALALGVSIRCAEGADAEHCDASDLAKILGRKRDEGRADVQLARMHPLIVTALPLGRPLAPSRGAGFVHRLALRQSPLLDRLVPFALRVAMAACEALSMRDKWRWALERAMDFCYWSGVRAEAASMREVQQYRDQRPPLDGAVAEIDLMDGLPVAEGRLDRLRPDGLRVRLGGEVIGEVHPEPGAEPLRGVHLRPLLMNHMADAFVTAAARAGLVPRVLQPCAAPSTWERYGIISPP